jgi:hypothetical protein
MEAPPPIPPARTSKSRGCLWLFIGVALVAAVLGAFAPQLFKMSGLTVSRTTEVVGPDGTTNTTTVLISGPGADRERLFQEGNTALDSGNVLARSLVPSTNQIGQECQTVDGLAAIRQNPATAQQIARQWGEVRDLYYLAAKKWSEAAPIKPATGRTQQWLELKARSLEKRAEYCGVSQEMVNLMLDPSLPTPAEVIAQLRPALARRVAGETEAAKLWAEADAVPDAPRPDTPVEPPVK